MSSQEFDAWIYDWNSEPRSFPGFSNGDDLVTSTGLTIELRWYTPNDGIFQDGAQVIHMETFWSVQFATGPDRQWLFLYNSVNGGDGNDTIYGYDSTVAGRIQSYIVQNNAQRHFAGIDIETLIRGGSDVIAGGSGNDLIFGQEGDDVLHGDVIASGDSTGVGVTFDDTLHGDEGDDTLKGNQGDDTLHGGIGNDTAVYDGALHDFKVILNGDNSVTVIDQRVSAAEGTDTLHDIEQFRFNGIVWSMSQVLDANTPHPPQLVRPVDDQVTKEDDAWTFTLPAGTFSDPDQADVLTYAASLADGSSLPAWLNFNPATGTFSGTPPKDFNGALDFKVVASDGTAGVSDIFRLTVLPVDDGRTHQISGFKKVQTIDDFDPATDQIFLQDGKFKGLGVGSPDGAPLTVKTFVANTSGLATNKKGAQIIYETDTGRLYYDSDGKKGPADAVHFATISNKAPLTISDFELF
ncbi:MAG TPA: putative Ig domain-containing protein [Microvirga sp.]|jgi:Ca2+-binding RTX toxin-like protein|nr:putative Ig domain-containing protein [Microvirga sp.]